MTTTEAMMGYAGAPANAGSTANLGIAGFAIWEPSEEAAPDAIDRDLEMTRYTQARDYAVWLFEEGSSAAQVWEELVSHGVDQAGAEMIVKEVLEQRQNAIAASQQAAIEAAHYQAVEDLGSFGRGAVFAFFFSWIALIASFLSSSMGSETKKGIRVVFAVKLFITLMVLASR
jgi:hypothetical protein